MQWLLTFLSVARGSTKDRKVDCVFTVWPNTRINETKLKLKIRNFKTSKENYLLEPNWNKACVCGSTASRWSSPPDTGQWTYTFGTCIISECYFSGALPSCSCTSGFLSSAVADFLRSIFTQDFFTWLLFKLLKLLCYSNKSNVIRYFHPCQIVCVLIGHLCLRLLRAHVCVSLWGDTFYWIQKSHWVLTDCWRMVLPCDVHSSAQHEYVGLQGHCMRWYLSPEDLLYYLGAVNCKTSCWYRNL